MDLCKQLVNKSIFYPISSLFDHYVYLNESVIQSVNHIHDMLADGSDTTSHTNTIELYGPTKETHLYPAAHSDEARSYGTSDRYQEDDYSDDYKSYEVGTRWHVPVWFWFLTRG